MSFRSPRRSLRAVLLAATVLAVAGPALADADLDEAADGDSAVTVHAQREEAGASATGLDLSLRETPQSVTEVSRLQIQDFGLNNVNQLLDAVPGINVERVETDRTYFNARGFDITAFQVDGVGLPLIWGIQFGDLDTALFERVDIVRGANGMLSGVGNPSATINYVRKRPTADFQGEASVSYGSWNDLRLEADVSGPLNASGSVRGRLVYANQDRDSYLDFNKVNRNVFYGVLTADLTDRLNVTVGASRQDNRASGVLWGALPLVYANGERIPWDRSASTSADWTYWDTLDTSTFAEGVYDFGGGWTAKASYTHKTFEENAKLLYAYGAPDPVTGLGIAGMSGRYPSKYKQDLLDLQAAGPLELFGRSHEVVLGASYARGTGREWEDFSPGAVIYPSVQDFGTVQPAEPTYPGAYLAAFGSDRLTRLYGAAHLNFSDRLKGVVGFNAIELKSTGQSYGVDQTRSEQKVSPYVGLVFDVTPNVSLYASYTDIFNPQSEVDINHTRLDSAKGQGLEAGIKSQWFGGHLYATASVFRARQENLAQYAGAFPNGDSYYSGVDTTSKGYELEVAGAITDRWTVAGGWTHLSLEDEAGADTRTFLPRRSLKLSTTYSLPELRDLKLGAALRWQSDIFMAGTPVSQDSYAVVDAMAAIDVTDHVRATLNVRNLFDETYLTSLMWNQSYYAAPRSVSLTLRYGF